jgi:RluA family pseudouridine synthase
VGPAVLYLDNHLLVVDKPPGMLAQADATGDLDLVTWAKGFLKHEFDKPGNVFVGLVHRLDRPVGGVTVLARTSKAASRLSDQFRRRTVQKTYLALVEGRAEGGGERVDWLRKTHSRERGTRVSVTPPEASGAKRAVLRWTPRTVLGRRTLVEVRPETGRPHQIRVQLAAMGHPIVGDLRYGSDGALGEGAGIALHAIRLEIDHPTQRDRRRFESLPPSVWGGEVLRAARGAIGASGA